MKTTLLIAVLGFSASAMAQDSITTSKVLFQERVSYRTSENYMRATTDIAAQGLAAKGSAIVAAKLTELNAELQCSQVTIQWGPMRIADDSLYAWTYVASSTITVHCFARSYEDRIAISAQQSCEKEPRPACLTRDYLEMFRKIRPMVTEELNRPLRSNRRDSQYSF